MATLVSDNFDRANSTTTVGSPQVGPAPTVWNGTMGISSNALYCATLVSSEGVAVWDAATVNAEIAVTRTQSITGNFGIILCATSNTDYWYIDCTNNPPKLYRRNATAFMPITQLGDGYAGAMGDRVVASYRGGWFRYSLNGTEVARVNLADSGIPVPTGTNFGVRFVSVTNPKVDDLLISDAPAIPVNPVANVAQLVITYQPGTLALPDGFAYRGRDNKSLDIAGGA